MIAANYVSRGVRDMPGFQEGLNRTSIQQRVDSSDSLQLSEVEKLIMTVRKGALS
jgi:hypothetical protein